MRELKSNEFHNVVQLLQEEKVHCTFAYSVVEGKQPGRVFVDNPSNPECCLVICKGGKYLSAGDTSNPDFNEFISSYLTNRENHSNYFDLYSSSGKWVSKFDEILGANAVKLNRVLFEWEPSSLASITNFHEQMPQGFELKRMDAALFEKYVKEMDASYSDLWGSCDNFIANGFGFCVLKDGEFVSVCNTYYVSQGRAEIDITTRAEYRRQGFALIACAAFIMHCARKGLNPIWDCDGGNENSKKLAVKLGFRGQENYQMHWWHENKKVIEGYLKKFEYTVG